MSNKILNISCNYNFLNSLFSWLENNFSNPANIKIILPSRRACNELKLLFNQKNYLQNIPQIKALSDIGISDIREYSDHNDEEIINQINSAKKIDNLEAIFFISNQIKKLDIFGNINFEQSCKIAIRIQEIFDEIEYEQINFSKLNQIDDIDLALHRQLTLEFIKDFYIQTKAELIKKNLFFASAYQNFIIDKFHEILLSKNSDKILIIAGSTGSLNCGKKLIKAITKQKNGYVIFNNFVAISSLSSDLTSNRFSNISSEELSENKKEISSNHPQFFNSQLIKFLDINEKDIETIKFEKEINSPNYRNQFINELTKLGNETISWQNFKNHHQINDIKADILNNFTLIEAQNHLIETEIICKIIDENHKSNQRIAVIINCQQLTNTIELKLKSLDINFFNSNSIGLNNNKLIIFILKILQLRESDFNSYQLLSIFKNQFFALNNDDLTHKFELNILRQSREYSGLKGIINYCNNDSDLKIFFNNFLENLPKNNSIEEIIKSLEKLSSKSFDQLLNDNAGAKEINLFFTTLINLKYQISSASEFDFLSSQISYFENSNENIPVMILSNIEARLLNFDIIFLCGLNYGDFPQIIDEGWLGKHISRELGIDRQSKKIGQNAFDFCNYLGNKKVILSRCVADTKSIRIASPFLQKFKALIKKIGVKDLNIINEFQQNFSNMKSSAIKIPSFQVPKNLLPKKISITAISQLKNDPYSYFAEKILKLKPLNPIDFQPSNREFGTFIHQALELYISDNLVQNNFRNIFKKYFNNIEAQYTWFSRFEKIFLNFLIENNQYLECKNMLELQVSYQLFGMEINGKIDRVIIDKDSNIKIFDYKTGAPPTKKSVVNGIEMQLTLSALLLSLNGICQAQQIDSLNYWKLSIRDQKSLTEIQNSKNEISQLITNTKLDLEQIMQQYFVNNHPFCANQKTGNSIFKNIARFEEWNI